MLLGVGDGGAAVLLHDQAHDGPPRRTTAAVDRAPVYGCPPSVAAVRPSRTVRRGVHVGRGPPGTLVRRSGADVGRDAGRRPYDVDRWSASVDRPARAADAPAGSAGRARWSTWPDAGLRDPSGDALCRSTARWRRTRSGVGRSGRAPSLRDDGLAVPVQRRRRDLPLTRRRSSARPIRRPGLQRSLTDLGSTSGDPRSTAGSHATAGRAAGRRRDLGQLTVVVDPPTLSTVRRQRSLAATALRGVRRHAAERTAVTSPCAHAWRGTRHLPDAARLPERTRPVRTARR